MLSIALCSGEKPGPRNALPAPRTLRVACRLTATARSGMHTCDERSSCNRSLGRVRDGLCQLVLTGLLPTLIAIQTSLCKVNTKPDAHDTVLQWSRGCGATSNWQNYRAMALQTMYQDKPQQRRQVDTLFLQEPTQPAGLRSRDAFEKGRILERAECHTRFVPPTHPLEQVDRNAAKGGSEVFHTTTSETLHNGELARLQRHHVCNSDSCLCVHNVLQPGKAQSVVWHTTRFQLVVRAQSRVLWHDSCFAMFGQLASHSFYNLHWLQHEACRK